MWRFLAGLSNGVLTAVKTMASEIATNPEDRNRGQAWTESAWSTGLIIGPAIGGCLAMPCGTANGDTLLSLNWAALFDGIFCVHPFLLPCFWGAILHLLVLPCAFALPETGKRKGYSAPESKEEQVAESVSASVLGVLSPEAAGCTLPHAVAQDEVTPEDVALKQASARHDNVAKRASECRDSAVESRRASFPAWCSRDLTLLVFARSFAIMSYVMWNEVLSIWCMTPRFRGGLQWSAQSIGQAWGVAGAFMCCLQLWLMPLIMNSLGPWRAVVYGSLLNVPTLALLPWIALVQDLPLEEGMANLDLDSAIADAEANTLLPTTVSFGILFSLMCIMNVFAQMVVIGTTVFIGNTVTTEYRARVNAFGIGVQSLFMAFAPTLGGLLFAWGIAQTPYHSHSSALDPMVVWPLGCHPVFLFCASVQIPVSCMASRISRSLERSPEDAMVSER